MDLALTNSQMIAHPMINPWLRGAHNGMVGDDVHLSGSRREPDVLRVRITATHPNQKKATA